MKQNASAYPLCRENAEVFLAMCNPAIALVLCMAGLVLLLVLLRPLAGLGGGSLRVRYDELEREITARIEDYQTLHENELESIIADSTAAYISEQAAHLGLTCRAEVRCEVRDGTPQPASAAMDIPYDARLAAAIADDLGIPAEKQSWQGGEAP